MTEAFGRALLDHHRGERDARLLQRDGEEILTHPIDEYYFDDYADGGPDWLDSWLEGPLLDVGAGAGRDTLYFQEQFETVAIEVSDLLVTLLDERGVADARRGDMFELTEQFEPDRFRSVLIVGTQLGLAKSMEGLGNVLTDVATITTTEGRAVVDCYDPTDGDASEMLGFRADPTPGLAYRVVTYEYEDRVDETLLFRLFSPERLAEAAADAGWTLAEVVRPGDAYYYRAALTKR